jgi:TolB protein
MNADGSGQRRITNDAAVAEWPTYAQGGTKIFYDSNRLGTNDIYSVNPDGTGVTRLTNNGATNFLPIESPDKNKILFTTALTGHFEMYLMNPDGTGVAALTRTPSYVNSVAFSFRK